MDPRTERGRTSINRWRWRLGPQGRGRRRGPATVLALLLSASGLESFRFSAPRSSPSASSRRRGVRRACCATVWSGRCGAGVTDAQVAMTSRSATRRSRRRSSAPGGSDGRAAGRRAHSPRLVEKLVEQAIEPMPDARPRTAPSSGRRSAARRRAGRRGRDSSRWPSRSAPAYLRHRPVRAADSSRARPASSPYSIEVTPGNTKVPARRRPKP